MGVSCGRVALSALRGFEHVRPVGGVVELVGCARLQDRSLRLYEGRRKATWKREFKLPWREAGPPHHHDGNVDSDQCVVNEELSLSLRLGLGVGFMGVGLGFGFEGLRFSETDSGFTAEG